MRIINFAHFRNNSNEYIDKVENGDSFIIIREGRPVGKIVPFNNETRGWEREHVKIKLRSRKDTLDNILQERSDRLCFIHEFRPVIINRCFFH